MSRLRYPRIPRPPGPASRHRLPRAARRLGHARGPAAWKLSFSGLVSPPTSSRLGGPPRPSRHRADLRHPLRHGLDQARHPLEGRQGPEPCSKQARGRSRGPPRRRPRHGGLDDQPAPRRTLGTTCSSPTNTRAGPSPPNTAAPCACSCPGSTSGRAPSGSEASSSRRTSAGLLGDPRLPRPGRSLAGAALLVAVSQALLETPRRSQRRAPHGDGRHS